MIRYIDRVVPDILTCFHPPAQGCCCTLSTSYMTRFVNEQRHGVKNIHYHKYKQPWSVAIDEGKSAIKNLNHREDVEDNFIRNINMYN